MIETLIVVLLMMALNAVFAAYEMALASVSRGRLLLLVEQKRRGAVSALFMKDRMEASLAVVQLGITLAGLIGAAVGGAGMEESVAPHLQATFGFSEPWAEFLALALFVIPLSALIILFAELVPKTFAIQNKEGVCLALSPIMRLLAQLANPIISLFERAVKVIVRPSRRKAHAMEPSAGLHELHAAVALARSARLIGAHQEKIVVAAAQLSARPVRDILLPASAISMIPVQCTLAEALLRAHLDLHTRFPVCEIEGNPQTICGYITFKDIIVSLKMGSGGQELRAIVRPMKYVEDQEPIAGLLETMVRERIHIAIVRSSTQRLLGMVTLEDIVEELTGDIEDEVDRLPAHVHATGSGWIVGGGALMSAVASTAGLPWPTPPAEGRSPTVAEWAATHAGRPLTGGQTIEQDGLSMLVRKLRRGKLLEAFVATGPGQPANQDQER